MANDDGNDDRLTKNEFAELIQHLSVQEILSIEYRVGSNWGKLFSRKNSPSNPFVCNLCVLETSSFKNLLAHIDGRKHKLQMERVKQLYHSDYTYSKNYKKEVLKQKEDGVKTCGIDNAKYEDTESSKHGFNVQKNKAVDYIKSTNVQGEFKNSQPSTEVGIKHEVTEMELFTQNKKRDQCVDNKREIQTKKVTTRIGEKKNSLAANNIEGNADFKTSTIVLNPAAALSIKADSMKAREDNKEESNKKLQYQRDKIIIPTVHKNKSHKDRTSQSKTVQTLSNDLPKFSVKSYSSSPSYNDVHGILGVEYVIKVLKNRNDFSPRYECGLCELVLDGFAMQRHLEGYNHRMKFCEKHFPTAIRQYRQYMQNIPESELFKVMSPVLAKLAIAIEQHHGRNLPYECYERDFSLNRHEILAKAFSCRHASEQYGPTFSHVVGSREIDEFINNRHKYSPAPFSRTAIFDMKSVNTGDKCNNPYQNSRNTNKESQFHDRHRHSGQGGENSNGIKQKSYMSSDLNDHHSSTSYKQRNNINSLQQVDDETYNLMVDDFLKGTLNTLPRKNIPRDNRKHSASSPHYFIHGKYKSLSPLRQNDIWQAYRLLVDQELYNIDERFKEYRKDPETHPLYNEEWQKFWKRRKDELVSTGLDHRNYNYQPEWVRFVKIRIEELYGQEVENIKIKSRERLCLPLSNEQLQDVKYHVQIEKIDTENEMLTSSCNAEPTTVLSTSLTPFHSSNNTTPQVVSVLRLMTALEDNLGSLGPKITDLLSKALQTEKTNPLHVNAIILSEDNCQLIETAKEKLKGLVITGFFEGSKKKVLYQVVKDAEALLKYAYQCQQQLTTQRFTGESAKNRSQTNSSLLFEFPSTNISSAQKPQSHLSSVSENELTRMGKKELASKLAASLVAQGKTDFDPQQLQQLITVYKLIEKKKREHVGTSFSHKGVCSLQESASSSKKTLSDTLSDLLKSSSSSVRTYPNLSKAFNIPQTTTGSVTQKPDGKPLNLVLPNAFQSSIPSSSFTSVLQNASGNYFNNTPQSIANTLKACRGGGNPLEQEGGYSMNYTGNLSSNQQNVSTVYNNQYQYNDRMVQNWGWNSNIDQNYNMGRPNNNFHESSNWQNF